MALIRTFVAIDIQAELRRKAGALIRELSEQAPSIRWVRPDNLHVTLKFLGDVKDNELYAICQATKRSAARHAPFQVSCRGVGAFPRIEKPRTIWIGIDDPHLQLTQFYKDVEAELFELGFAKELRPYQPHITIGRVSQRNRRPEPMQAVISAHQGREFGTIEAEECLVYSSEMTGDGPVYTPLGRAPLSE